VLASAPAFVFASASAFAAACEALPQLRVVLLLHPTFQHHWLLLDQQQQQHQGVQRC
jgi:hypothetical protein